MRKGGTREKMGKSSPPPHLVSFPKRNFVKTGAARDNAGFREFCLFSKNEVQNSWIGEGAQDRERARRRKKLGPEDAPGKKEKALFSEFLSHFGKWRGKELEKKGGREGICRN